MGVGMNEVVHMNAILHYLRSGKTLLVNIIFDNPQLVSHVMTQESHGAIRSTAGCKIFTLHISARLKTFLARQLRCQRQGVFELVDLGVVEVDLSLFGEAKSR